VLSRSLLHYLLGRLLAAALLVLLVSSGAFLLARLAPGDAAMDLFGTGASAETIARERARLGLDRPLPEQYLAWLGRLARFDLGTSLLYQRPVGELVRERAMNTALLAGVALLLGTLVGLPLGVLTGSRPASLVAALVRAASLVALSLPPLVTALALVWLAARTGWVGLGGLGASGAAAGTGVARVAAEVVPPALALALPLAATLERLQARALADALGERFVLAAVAWGVPPRRVLWRHALPVALKPVAALYGIFVGHLLSGSFAVEIVTAWPGLGRLAYEAMRARDLYLVAGCAAAGSLVLALGTLVSDGLVAAVDPRVRDRD
jgi:peptide/nickel transport system permease protein